MKNTTVLFVHIVAWQTLKSMLQEEKLGNLFYIIIDIIF